MKSGADNHSDLTPGFREDTAAQPRSGIVTFTAEQVEELTRKAYESGVRRGLVEGLKRDVATVIERDGEDSPEDGECIICNEQITEGSLIRIAHKGCVEAVGQIVCATRVNGKWVEGDLECCCSHSASLHTGAGCTVYGCSCRQFGDAVRG